MKKHKKEKTSGNLEYDFYKWVYPKFKKYTKHNINHPVYLTQQEWKEELRENLFILEKIYRYMFKNCPIIESDIHDPITFMEWYNSHCKGYYGDYEAHKQNVLASYVLLNGHEIDYYNQPEYFVMSALYCSYLKTLFNKWFSENLCELWL